MSGHGHVVPNPNGTKARCGGPAICSECAREKAALETPAEPLRRKPDDRYVVGHCPMGCGRTLFLADGGYITCSYIHCPRPDAVADLLADSEISHIVQFGEDTFTVRHPLRERLDDALMTCVLHEHIAGLDGPPVQPGRYRAHGAGSKWSWEPLP